ncbi:MAG TPA: LamG domain-containing protein, partial [Sedimentisphaerales bacterium]|nr:LamG domain-containing protein [Sedimentisphaerales bacterium]
MYYKKLLFLTLVTFFLSSMAIAADPNLVGWYKFNESSGTVAADSSGYGHNATVNATSGWDTSGYNGGCLNFTGTLKVSVPSTVFTDVNEQVTISVWVNGNTAYPETGQILFHGASPARGRALQCEMPGGYNAIWFAAGDIDASITGGFDQAAVYNLPKAAYQGSWNNFTFVKNNIADVNEPTWEVYWNGLRKAYTTGLTAQMSGITTFTIGCRNDGTIPYQGKIDEFKIYDRALSRQEIASIFGVDPNKATNPTPLDGQEQILTTANLTWDAGLKAASHDVYLGTNETAVTNATTASAEYMGNFAYAEYDPVALEPNVVYYWRVDEVNDVDIWPGAVWSFRVIPPIPPMPNPLLWLKMDGPDSSNPRLVKDYSGNGMDGTMGSSDAWKEVPGLSDGYVIDFDGGPYGACGITFEANDVNNVIVANLDKTFTASCWVTW